MYYKNLMFSEAHCTIFKNDFKEKTLLSAIGTVIKNSKDWQGGRSERNPAMQGRSNNEKADEDL